MHAIKLKLETTHQAGTKGDSVSAKPQPTAMPFFLRCFWNESPAAAGRCCRSSWNIKVMQEETWVSTQRQGAGTNHLEEWAASLIMELQFWSVIIGCKFLLVRSFQLQSQEGLSTVIPFICWLRSFCSCTSSLHILSGMLTELRESYWWAISHQAVLPRGIGDPGPDSQ